MNPATGLVRKNFELAISAETGGGIGAVAGKTLTLSNQNKDVACFTFGAGTVVFSGQERPRDTEVREGTVRAARADEGQGTISGRDGATFIGGAWIYPSQAGANGGGYRGELQGKRMFRADGAVTVDLNGETLNWNDINTPYNGLISTTEFFAGTGVVSIVDNSVAKSATFQSLAYRDAAFRGTFSSRVPLSGGGLMLPHATWNVPAGVTHVQNALTAPRNDIQFARLTGAGIFTATSSQSYQPARFILGDDGAADADFAGTLTLIQGAGSCGALQLIKVGGNAQRLSGANNRFDGNTIVRAGALLAGAIIDVSAWPMSAFTHLENVYVLAEATGGFVDAAQVELVGLPENVATWRLSSSGNKLTLRCQRGCVIILH